MNKLKTHKEIFKTAENYERYLAALNYEKFSKELSYYDKSRESTINLFVIPEHELTCDMKKRIEERRKELVHLAKVYFAMESEALYKWGFKFNENEPFPLWRTLRLDILEKIIKS